MVQVRRLNEQEYKHSIADVFGPQIAVQGTFEPDTRIGGLLATSTTKESESSRRRSDAVSTYCFACCTQLSEYDEKWVYSVAVSSDEIYAGICSSRQDSHSRRCSG